MMYALRPRMGYRLKPYAPMIDRAMESTVTSTPMRSEFQKYFGKSVTDSTVA